MTPAAAATPPSRDPVLRVRRPVGRATPRRVGRLLGLLACIAAAGLGVALLAAGLRGPGAAPLPASTFSRAIAPPPTSEPRAATERIHAPNRLVIDSLGIDAALVPQRVDATGELVVPGDVRTVGLWADGPGLHAARGTTVLAGHVDRHGDLGALHPLHGIGPGAIVVATDSHGRAGGWRVTALQVHPKEDLPAFDTEGPRRLAIVTCGGAVVRTASGRGYADNVIAIAEPIASSNTAEASATGDTTH